MSAYVIGITISQATHEVVLAKIYEQVQCTLPRRKISAHAQVTQTQAVAVLIGGRSTVVTDSSNLTVNETRKRVHGERKLPCEDTESVLQERCAFIARGQADCKARYAQDVFQEGSDVPAAARSNTTSKLGRLFRMACR